MKKFQKIAIAFMTLLVFAGCAAAGITDLLSPKKIDYATKSAIPQAEPIEYRGLKLGADSASITIINRSETATYKFSAAVEFIDARGWRIGDFFIPETVIAPKQSVPLKGIMFNGDAKLAKANAKTLSWTIYKHEEVK